MEIVLKLQNLKKDILFLGHKRCVCDYWVFILVFVCVFEFTVLGFLQEMIFMFWGVELIGFLRCNGFILSCWIVVLICYYLYEIVVRFEYILSSLDPTYGIPLGTLLLCCWIVVLIVLCRCNGFVGLLKLLEFWNLMGLFCFLLWCIAGGWYTKRANSNPWNRKVCFFLTYLIFLSVFFMETLLLKYD